MSRTQMNKLEEKFNFKVVNRVKYLGIVFSTTALTLLKDNYEKYVKEIRHKMETGK